MLLLAIFLVLFFTVVPLFFTTFFRGLGWTEPTRGAGYILLDPSLDIQFLHSFGVISF